MSKTEKQQAYLKALEETGSTAAAARAAGVTPRQVKNWASDDPDFADAAELAIGLGGSTVNVTAQAGVIQQADGGRAAHLTIEGLLLGVREVAGQHGLELVDRQLLYYLRKEVGPARLAEIEAEVRRLIPDPFERLAAAEAARSALPAPVAGQASPSSAATSTNSSSSSAVLTTSCRAAVRPSSTASAAPRAYRRTARPESSLPGITWSIPSGEWFVSTTPTIGMPSLRASVIAILW